MAGVSQRPVTITLRGFNEPYFFSNRINEK
jgi:hypothetical protein